MKSPFSEGDRVAVVRHGKLGTYCALVLESKRDKFGWTWDVLVLPEDSSMESCWVNSEHLTLLRADGKS